MTGFAYRDLWEATLDLVRRRLTVLVPVAGAFLFLPGLILTTVESRLDGEQAESFGWAVANLAYVLAAALGQLTVLRIMLDASGLGDRSLGQAIGTAFRLLPRQIAVGLIVGLVTLGGLVLLIVPGLYIAARLAIAGPLLVARECSATECLRESWALSRGRAWTLLGYLLIWVGVTILSSLLAGAVAGAIGAALTLGGLERAGQIVGHVVLAGVISAAAVYLQAATLVLFLALTRGVGVGKDDV